MKFYNIVGNDIFIYGEIDDDFDAQIFAEQLNALDGQEVTVRINSAGGSVFSAIAMGNALRNYKGKVTASIEGLCASSAVLISSSCQRVLIAQNSLMMIHSAGVLLNKMYNGQQLATVQESLAKVQAACEATIKPRLKKPIDFSQETWFNAEEAVEYGLADEIVGQVNMQIDSAQDLIFVNKLVFHQHVPLRTVSTPKNEEVAAQILTLIKNQMESGAMGVAGGQNAPSEREMRINGIADIANGMI